MNMYSICFLFVNNPICQQISLNSGFKENDRLIARNPLVYYFSYVSDQLAMLEIYSLLFIRPFKTYYLSLRLLDSLDCSVA